MTAPSATSDSYPIPQIGSGEIAGARGKLKIFFGCSAGVGKTYAMLSAGRQRLLDGVDMVAGMVEINNREEMMKLLEGMPVIPLMELSGPLTPFKEFDLDIALLRKPDIILIDELAHTNAPGARHPHRWNDVEELLSNGINVYTTLNVQNLESLNDVVAGITGVRVKETIPDSVFDGAEDIVLIDINADELLKRLEEGKVYTDDRVRADTADKFFRKSNIIALRELALRRTIERVDAQMEAYKYREGIRDMQPAADKVIACIGPDHLSEKLIRTAKRIAASLKAPWMAIYVENARHYHLSEEGKKAVEDHMRLAEQLGGKAMILQGDNAVEEIITFARENGITKIVVGKSERTRWRDILFGSLADQIMNKSGYIDVYVVTGEAPADEENLNRTSDLVEFKPRLYLQSFLLVIACTALGILFPSYIKPDDQMILYLIGNVVVSASLGRGPSFLYAIFSATCFSFFFTGAAGSFNIAERSFWLTAIVMLVTSAVINSYAARLRLQTMFARKRDRNTQMLYAFARDIAATRGHIAISKVAARHIKDAVGADILVALPDKSGHLELIWGELQQRDVIRESGLMHWSFENRKPAGIGTNTMPSVETLYVPLITAESRLGVLGVTPKTGDKKFSTEQVSLIETFASLLASGIERANAATTAEQYSVAAESEKLRNVLLSSVSHDLRAPLMLITGASGKMVMESGKLPREAVKELAHSIHTEASHLSRIIHNLLDVMSLESGSLTLNYQPYLIEKLIDSSIRHLEPMLAQHKVVVHTEPDMPAILMDGPLIEKVIVHLLENAAKHTPKGSTITVETRRTSEILTTKVMDNGPGILPDDEKKIFNKFYTAGRNTEQRMVGLGLTICQGIIAAHHGTIWAENRPEGGVMFTFTLPVR